MTWKKEDFDILKTYEKYGYKTLIIWQYELKNPIQILEKIRGFLK